MRNQDLERLGEDIRRTIEDAIDSRNFRRLNQTIMDRVNRTTDSIARNLQSMGQNQGQNFPHTQAKTPQQSAPALYSRPLGTQVGSTVLTAVGFSFGGIFTVLFFILLLAVLFLGILDISRMLGLFFLLVLMGIGYGAGGCGIRMRGRLKRFRSYLQVLGTKEYCNIRELADQTHKNRSYVLKDLEKMISDGWFLQGHLDRQKTCLMVSHRVYEQYLSIEEERSRHNLETEKERNREEKEASPKVSPEIQKIVEAGDEYVRQIRVCNDAIPDAEISKKISRIELVVDRIFDRIEQEPDSVDDIHKLMDYYLPATIKLLKAYEELDSQPVDGENIRSSKEEIASTLDTLSTAFEKLLDHLFQDTAWDVSTDISVLRTMLAQEGLVEDKLKQPKPVHQ